MGRLYTSLIFAALVLQTTRPNLQTTTPDAANLIRDLRSAIEREELTKAADLAGEIDDIVRARYRAALIHDAASDVDEALTWLPVDTESLWVNQEPMTINSAQSMTALQNEPTKLYSLDRLATINGNKFYQALSKRTLRLVAAGARNIRPANAGIPGRPTRLALNTAEKAGAGFVCSNAAQSLLTKRSGMPCRSRTRSIRPTAKG
jgi:hypothetical protein